ncbi:TRAP transporter small permease [Pelagibacterium lentulum]|uniref:TRAP transporter small permease protein n=1 Tax=Pelagibacterium lentulum TaxID=2029865 RepID=A0A916RJW1_9HYPH|nr:TRAP transporter small permease [Pelagibacterium lentulum]GGA59423.1 C4-dicarboxylate ABC transporter permease [Pelagibacterium lentulum]
MKFLEKPINWLLMILLTALVVLANWAVVQRYVLGQPLHFTEEVSAMLLIWIVMIGAIAAERDNQHLSISFIVESLPSPVAKTINIAIGLLSLGIVLFVAWIGWQLTASVQTRATDILRISFFWTYVAMPVGLLGIAFYMAAQVVDNLKTLKKGDEHG